MENVLRLKCVNCGKEYAEDEILYTCKDCGIDGILDAVMDYGAIGRELNRETLKQNADFSMWRYLPALPIKSRKGIQPLHVGWTPLYECGQFADCTGLNSLFVKDDSRNPTASLKDRASAVGVARAVELGRMQVCAASTGNAASSLAGFAASAGMEAFIFVPETAPEAKVAQLLIYGAHVFLVKGTYDKAVELCFEAAEEFGWYNRSCAINPYLVEGKKTVAYEICEQLHWAVPDTVAVAVGDGCTVSAVWKGFVECRRLGLIDRLPRIVGVQAAGANPVSRAFSKGVSRFDYARPETIADSISVGVPRNGIKALNAVRESHGLMVDVTDEEILAAMRLLARRAGLFGEPAGVTGFAGVIKLKELGLLSPDERVCCIVSGSGLKDIRSAVRAAGQPTAVEPDMGAVRRAVQKISKP